MDQMLWYHSDDVIMDNEDNKPKREYPPLYEKGVPIAVGIVVAAIIILLIIIVVVALGVVPGAG